MPIVVGIFGATVFTLVTMPSGSPDGFGFIFVAAIIGVLYYCWEHA